MHITNIHESWGSIITFSDPLDFFDISPDYWRKMIYDRKLLIFKKMNFDLKDYVKFCLHYGELWEEEEYKFNKEEVEKVEINSNQYCVSPFSNKISRLGMREMPWHADIANPRLEKQNFCLRTLWITKNPNSENSGFTTWLDIEDSIKYLTKNELDLLSRVKVMQQSWLYPNSLIGEYQIFKKHPITGKLSLRLNWHNDEQTKNAYITGVKIDDKLQADCGLIKHYLNHFQKFSDTLYTHAWDTFDIALYDNWSFVHKRSILNFNPDLERHFYRTNINHISSDEWLSHKSKYLC
jgi:alpha-ketoglutarate-dependent taurine dioxygenase